MRPNANFSPGFPCAFLDSHHRTYGLIRQACLAGFYKRFCAGNDCCIPTTLGSECARRAEKAERGSGRFVLVVREAPKNRGGVMPVISFSDLRF